MILKIGPTGNVVKGSVLDVNPRTLERCLRDYDSQLYLSWNSKKRAGEGCWEIRRRPDKKSVTHQGEWNGIHFLKVEYVEQDLIAHVLDVPVLGYDVVYKLKQMDTWKVNDWISDYEYREAKFKEREAAKGREETRYMMQQHKKELRELKEMVASGFNLARIAQYWNK